MMLHALILLADAGKEAAEPAGNPGIFGMFGPLPMFLMIGVLFWVMMIRPAQRQEKERKAMIAALRKNDKVIAAGGIFGTVVNVKEGEEEVTIRIDDTVRIRVLRSSIARVIRDEEPAKEEAKQQA